MPAGSGSDMLSGMTADPDRAALREGVALYNRGEFFDAHEVMEEAWKGMEGSERHIYQGLIQVATAFHHARLGKLKSARKLLTRSLAHMRPHVDGWTVQPLADLLPAVEQVIREIERCEREDREFWAGVFPPMPEVA